MTTFVTTTIVGIGLFVFSASTSQAQATWSDDGRTPIFGKNATSSERKKVNTDTDNDLKVFKSRTFLNAKKSALYANDPGKLVGEYCWPVGKSEELECAGTSQYVPKQSRTDLKDDYVLKQVINNKFTFGVGLVFLNIKLSDEQVAEMTVQDTVTILTNPLVDEITCRFPIELPAEAAGKVVYIQGATVTTITNRQFSKGEAGGDAAFAMVKINGTTYTSTEVIKKQKVVSVSPLIATPLTRDANYPAKKAACDALLKKQPEKPESVAQSVLREWDFNAQAIAKSQELTGPLAKKTLNLEIK
jgi:hypothetical protein